MKKSQKNEILVIAHRGASGYEPENTMRAFHRAAELKADGIEFDIHQHVSGEILVAHDNDLKRMGRSKLSVRTARLDTIRKVDVGQGERVPLLTEVLEEFLPKFKIINIEIKSHGIKKTGIEIRLAKLILDFKCEDKVLVSSFNPLHLMRFRSLLPQVKIGYLLCPEQIVLVRNRKVIAELKPDTLNLDKKMMFSKKHKVLFENKFPKWVWTVNEESEMRFWVREPHIKAIITNYPDRLKKILAR